MDPLRVLNEFAMAAGRPLPDGAVGQGWDCPCGFKKNHAHRSECYQCHAKAVPAVATKALLGSFRYTPHSPPPRDPPKMHLNAATASVVPL